jgi:hypothetical protein
MGGAVTGPATVLLAAVGGGSRQRAAASSANGEALAVLIRHALGWQLP